MNNLDNYSVLYTYEGGGHVPFNSNNMDFEFEYTSEFLYDIACSGPQTEIGDINEDTLINILDVIILVNFALNISEPSENQLFISDLNEDDVLNVLDVIILVNMILGR